MKKLRIRKKKEIALHQILSECLNCGKPLASDDVFCSYCGQKNVEKLNFASFIGQLISGIFSYDSRFWTTFIPLLLKPGVVSRNYIDGKRKRYVNPFQLYLQVSILFFLLLGISHKMDETILVSDIPESQTVALDSILNDGVKDELLKELDSVDLEAIETFNSNDINIVGFPIDSTYQYKVKQDSIEQISLGDMLQDFNAYQERNSVITSSTAALNDLGYPITFWNTFYFEQIQRLKSNIEEFQSDKGKGFMKKLISKLSIGLFIFLPLFTLSFKLIYFRKKMNYMEHLVFVFHTQTVFFLLMTIYIIIGFITGYEGLWPFMLLFLIYLFMSLQRFYKQGWFKTFIKFILLNIIYLNIGGVAMAIISLIAFLFD